MQKWLQCVAVAKHCYFQSSVTNYLLTLKKKKYCHTSYVWRLDIVISNKIMLFVDLLIHCELKPRVIIWGIFCFSYNCLSNFLFTAISLWPDYTVISVLIVSFIPRFSLRLVLRHGVLSWLLEHCLQWHPSLLSLESNSQSNWRLIMSLLIRR